jgi:hypothetical protein
MLEKQAAGVCRKLHNEGLCTLYSRPNSLSVIKLRGYEHVQERWDAYKAVDSEDAA